MISFNVVGCCVSRDILNPLIDRGGVQVLQYSGFASPVSMFSGKGDFEISMEDMRDYQGPNFYKRSLCFDINKHSFDYIIEKKADYILVDILAARLNMLKKGDHLITITNPVVINRERLNKDFGLDKYEEITPFDINEQQWEEDIDKLCNSILKHYSPKQIIFHRYYQAVKYVGGQFLGAFGDDKTQLIRKTNELIKKLDVRVEKNLKCCHIIETPDYVLADKASPRGIHPLHYTNDYYEYGAKALKIIFRNLTDEQERAEISELRSFYEAKFKLLNEKLDLNNRLQWVLNAQNFAKELLFDQFGSNKFENWLEKCAMEHSKIAVIKAGDAAGQVLLKALAKYNIEVIFTTPLNSFEVLKDEEIEECRQADIIISADVHGTAPITNGELTAIRIADLIK